MTGDRREMKLPQERQQAIIELVTERGRLSIADLTQHLGVSEMTIRRDLALLDSEGTIRRIHGGALPVVSGSYEPPFGVRTKLKAAAKQEIAALVGSRIGDGETVILDGGTTAAAIAEVLLNRNISICTLSLRVADVLTASTAVRLMIAGGIVRPDERSLIGPAALRIFEDHRFDVYIMTASGIHISAGITEWNLDDTAVKRAALRAANRCIVACDASKFGKTAFGRICGVEEVDTIVTDSAIDPRQQSAFGAVDVNFCVA